MPYQGRAKGSSEKRAQWETKAAAVLILAFAVFFPVFLQGAKRALGTGNNNVRQWLPNDYEETKTYEWFRKHFGTDEFILVSWAGCRPNDPRLSRFVDQVKKQNAATPKVQRLFASIESGPELLRKLTRDPFNFSVSSAARRLKGLMFGKTFKLTCAIVTLTPKGDVERVRAVNQLRAIATENIRIAAEALHLAGEPVFNAEIDIASERATAKLPFWSALTALLVAVVSLSSLRRTLFVFIVAIYCGVLAQAMVFFGGSQLNLVLVVMPVLIYVLSLSAAVHMVNYFRDSKEYTNSSQAALDAIRRGWLPCTLAALTTAIGVGSLYSSHIRPVHDFGIYSAIGIVFALSITLLLLPSLLSLFGGHRKMKTNPDVTLPWLKGLLNRLADLIIYGRRWIVAIGVAAILWGAIGVGNLTTDVAPRRFFPEGSRLLQDYNWVESNFGPIVPIELVMKVDMAECPLNILQQIHLVDQLQQEVEGLDNIGATMSAATFTPHVKSSQRYGIRSTIERTRLKHELEKHENAFTDLGFLSSEKNSRLWRISARASTHHVDKQRLLASVEQEITTFLEKQGQDRVAGISMKYTGMVPLFYLAQKELLSGLFRSFLMAFGLIAVLMVIILRSFLGGLVAMFPNIFPTAVVFGFMGHTNSVVDIGAMLTASAAMGIAVDDTVHFLTWFRRGLVSKNMKAKEAVIFAYRKCSAAMLQTTVIVGLSLAVYTTSTFQPVSQFGLLMSVLLAVTLVGDLVLLPALLAGPAGMLFENRSVRVDAIRMEHEAMPSKLT